MKRKRKEKFIQAITVAAMMAWIITAREVHSLRMQEIIVFVTSTIWLVLIYCSQQKDMEVKDMKVILGKIFWNAICLNRKKNITAFVCYHGNTDCICVTVENKGVQVYQNKVFANNRKKLKEMAEHLRIMRDFNETK